MLNKNIGSLTILQFTLVMAGFLIIFGVVSSFFEPKQK